MAIRCFCGDPECPSCGTAQGTYVQMAIIRSKCGSYLYSFDVEWMNYGDDPTCWTDDKAKAMKMPWEEAERYLKAVRAWHEAEILNG